MALTERYVSSTGTDTYANSTNPATPMSLSTAFTSAVAGDRINIKADGTYSRTATDTFTTGGTPTSPIVFRGYASAITDGYQGRTNGNGPLVTTNMPLIDYGAGFRLNASGVFLLFQSLRFSGVMSASLVTNSGSNAVTSRCSITNTSTGGSAKGLSVGLLAIDCDITGSGNGVNGPVVEALTNTRVLACRIKGATSTTPGIQTHSSVVVGCTLIGAGGIGIQTAFTSSALVALNNTFSGWSDAVEILTGTTSLNVLVGNMITDNTGYGIDLVSAGNAAFLAYNRTRDNTSGAINLGTDWVSATSFNHVTTDTGGPETDYVSAGSPNFDYRLIATSPAKGAGIPAYASIGALQREESASGSGGVSRGRML